MIKWFKNMRRKQKESDDWLSQSLKIKEDGLKKEIINLIKEYREVITEWKIKYNIIEEDLK